MSKTQEVIKAVFQQAQPFYSSTIMSLSGSSVALVSNTLNELKDAGKIVARKEGKKLVYSLTDAPHNQKMSVTVEPMCSMAEKFQYIRDLVNMVITGVQPSVLITGQPGVGKTFLVKEQLAKMGKRENHDYLMVSGYATPFGLFKTLHDNRDALLVMDDIDSVFDKDASVNVLKAALDSYDTRRVSWISEKAEQQDLESPFDFTGRIIFISNRFADRIDAAIRSRGFCFDLRMTNSEISEHMGNILQQVEPQVELHLKQETLEYLTSIEDQFVNYNLRTLIQAIRIRKFCVSTDKNWKQMIHVLTQEV
jgi:replication-associated recombination protein RarA